MALPALRVRFVFNQTTGDTKAQTLKNSKRFAAGVVGRLTFAAADQEYARIKKGIENSFAKDAKAELTHMAALYRRHIVGAGSTRTRPSGMLSYALGPSETDIGFDDENYEIGDSLPGWAPRTAKYLAEKKRRKWPSQWFKATGYLQRNMRAQTLMQAFGPIRVTVSRNKIVAPTRTLFDAGGTAKSKVNVATVRVYALSNITPSMLPALATGNPTTMNSDDGNDGLMGLLKRADPGLAYRLGRRSGKDTGRRYRPTLEPFLAFYLTRSIPNALALRLQGGRLRPERRFNG